MLFYPSITCIYIYILIFMYISLSHFSTHSVQSDLNFQLLHLRPCWKTPSPTKSGSISSCTLRRSGRRRNSFSRPSRWEQMWRWALKATVDLVGPSVFLFKKCGLDFQLMCCWSFFGFGRPLFYCNVHRASAEKQLILLTAANFWGKPKLGVGPNKSFNQGWPYRQLNN